MAKPIPHSHGTVGAISQSDAIPKIAQKGFFSKAVDFVSGIPVKLAEYAASAPFTAPILVSVLSGVGKLEKIPGLKTIGSYAKSRSQRITDLMEKEVGQVFSGKNYERIGAASQELANVVGDGVNKAANALRIPDYAPKLSDMNALRHLGRLRKTVDIAKNSLTPGIPENLHKDLHTAIDKMVNLAESQKGMSLAEFEPHRNAFLKVINDNATHLDKKATRAFNKILSSTSKVIKSSNNASVWKNLGGMFKTLPGAIASSKFLPGIANAGLIVLAVASLVRVVTNFVKSISGLKTMSKDITGKEISTMDVLRGKGHALIKEGRTNLIKTSIVSGVTDTISLGFVTKNAARGGVGFLGFMAPEMAGKGVNALIGESSLPVYTALSQMHASGQKISGEAYAELLGKISPEIKARGGANNAFAQKLGEIYAEENATPAQVVRRVTSGDMLKDLHALMAANEAAKATPAAAVAGSHVKALKKSAAVRPNKEILGEHTKNIVEKASQAHALNVV